eukprot:98879-Prorocentrum_minimum.AAC.1
MFRTVSEGFGALSTPSSAPCRPACRAATSTDPLRFGDCELGCARFRVCELGFGRTEDVVVVGALQPGELHDDIHGLVDVTL